jgi:hypothetical protein
MMKSNNLKHQFGWEPTYWPSDRNKVPDLVDFYITKGIPQDFAVAKSYLNLFPYHPLILITLTVEAQNQEK